MSNKNKLQREFNRLVRAAVSLGQENPDGFDSDEDNALLEQWSKDSAEFANILLQIEMLYLVQETVKDKYE